MFEHYLHVVTVGSTPLGVYPSQKDCLESIRLSGSVFTVEERTPDRVTGRVHGQPYTVQAVRPCSRPTRLW
jgi:hypothetical protein